MFDATGLTDSSELGALRDFFAPLMRSLEPCPRLVVIGTPPETVAGSERVAQRALEGFTRSLGKEVGRGGTVQLVYVAEGRRPRARLAVDPGVPAVAEVGVRLGPGGPHRHHAATTPTAGEVADWLRPLEGKVALVTGASRGIGEQIARVLHRDGATVIGVDVPQAAADSLVRLTNELEGDYLALDITGKDAPQRIAQQVLTRARRRRHRRAQRRHHPRQEARQHGRGPLGLGDRRQPHRPRADHPRAARPEGDPAPTAGSSASRRSPASPATSARPTTPPPRPASSAWSTRCKDELPDGITVNAVAPGFIETQMTAAVPFATREVGRRLNAMSQGGLPVDVAETIAWFASPGSTAVNGNVVRVCGQMMLGA